MFLPEQFHQANHFKSALFGNNFFFLFRTYENQYFMHKCWKVEIISPLPRLQIIDSIMALFRVDFSGRGELAERQQKLAQMLSRLQKISEGLYKDAVNVRNESRSKDTPERVNIAWTVLMWAVFFYLEYNVAVFVTNQMTADPGAGMTWAIAYFFNHSELQDSDIIKNEWYHFNFIVFRLIRRSRLVGTSWRMRQPLESVWGRDVGRWGLPKYLTGSLCFLEVIWHFTYASHVTKFSLNTSCLKLASNCQLSCHVLFLCGHMM